MKIVNHDLVLDGIDKQILDHLVKMHVKSILEIAKNIGSSGVSVHQRVRKMEEVGIISGSYIKINQEKLGYTTQAFVRIFLDKATHNNDAVAMLEEIPEVTSCYYTTGDWSLLIQLNCKDNNHLSSLLSGKIQNITGVLRTEPTISLKKLINRQIPTD